MCRKWEKRAAILDAADLSTGRRIRAGEVVAVYAVGGCTLRVGLSALEAGMAHMEAAMEHGMGDGHWSSLADHQLDGPSFGMLDAMLRAAGALRLADEKP